MILPPVAVLCARKNTVYRDQPGVDVYDADRDALTFLGGMPVVAHPPCRLWSKLAHFAKPAEASAERDLAHFCVGQVRSCGGVLEHPANSRLFVEANLPRPGRFGAGGFTFWVPQWWFGHLGAKDTWLFVAGVHPRDFPTVPLRLDSPERRPVENLCQAQREATPPELASWLIRCARRASLS